MNRHLYVLAAAALLAPAAALADTGPYSELVSKVQEKLLALGFDAGPVNGDFDAQTQAALAQFQRSVPIPAGGQLDDQTLDALGVKRDEPA